MSTLTLRLIDTETSAVDALAKRMRQACDSGKAAVACVKVGVYLHIAKRSLDTVRKELGDIENVTAEDAAGMREAASKAHNAVAVMDDILDHVEHRSLNRLQRFVLEGIGDLRDSIEDVAESMALGADEAFRADMRTVVEQIHRGPRPQQDAGGRVRVGAM